MSKASMRLEELVRTFAQEAYKCHGATAAAGTRARKALMEIKRLCDSRRKEIQDAKNAG